MRDALKSELPHLLFAALNDFPILRIDLQELACQRIDQGDAQRSLLVKCPEPSFALAQGLFRVLPCRNVHDQAHQANRPASGIDKRSPADVMPSHLSVRPNDAVLTTRIAWLLHGLPHSGFGKREILRVNDRQPVEGLSGLAWSDAPQTPGFLGDDDPSGQQIQVPNAGVSRLLGQPQSGLDYLAEPPPPACGP